MSNKTSEAKFRSVRNPAKNAKAHARNVAKKQGRREDAEKRNARFYAMSREEKISCLFSRPGYCEKQLKKLGFIVD